MAMDDWARLAAVLAIVGTAAVYGTDVFCAMVLRPALARVDDGALGEVTGWVHHYGDRRMPAPGVLGIAGAAASTALAAIDDRWTQATSAGVATVLLVAWLIIYARVSAPINRQLTAAAIERRVLPNVRALQSRWDRVIDVRAALQGLALVALCVALIA